MPNFSVLDDYKFLEALNEKLLEEVAEYQRSKNLEKLADILQVICAISEIFDGGKKELEYIMDEKAAERGRFETRTFLESIDYMKRS